MKKLLLLLTMFSSTVVFAFDEGIFKAKTVEGVEMTFYAINENETEVYASTEDGKSRIYADFIEFPPYIPCVDSLTHGRITIPETINGLTVRKIQNGAFFNCKNITEIVIPKSVVEIGDNAFMRSGIENIYLPTSFIGDGWFYECRNLRTVKLAPLSEEHPFYSIGKSAFCGCVSLTDYGTGGQPVVVSEASFARCESIKRVVLGGNEAFNIPNSLFEGCVNLESVQLSTPMKIYGVGSRAFKGCLKLESMAFLSAMAENYGIGGEAFYGCQSLKVINIPEGTTNLGGDCFVGCSGATSLYIPSTVRYIESRNEGSRPFRACANLNSIVVSENNGDYDSRNNCNAIIAKNGDAPTLIVGCNGTIVPSSVRSIAEGAFNGCATIERLVIPEGVEQVERDAISACPKLSFVSLPKTVERACHIFKDDEIVYGKMGIIDTIHNSCPILAEMYIDCPTIDEINLPALKKVSFGPNVKKILRGSFSECSLLESVFIPKTIEEIGKYTGVEYDGDKYVVADNLHLNPFNGSSLKSIVVEEGNLFYDSRNDCNAIIVTSSNLLSAGCSQTVIPQSVTAIGYGAFNNVPIKEIVVAAHVKSIAEHAFRGCPLQSIVIESEETDIDKNAFADINATDLYLEAPVIKRWLREVYLEALTIGPKTKRIGTEAFRTSQSLKKLSLPEGLQSIGEGAFWSCNQLEELTIPSTVTYIGIDAFRSCESLRSVTSKIVEPFFIDYWVFYTNNDKVYSQAILYVPAGTKQAYMDRYAWNKFLNIVELDGETGINIKEATKFNTGAYYSIDGRKLTNPLRGLNIIRQSNGRKLKILRR